MSEDEELQGRDLRIMWRTVTTVAVIVAAVIGTIITAVVWEVKQDGRIEGVEKWQARKDKQEADDARFERFRRDRERNPPLTPPKS